jgi:hypothetical protein
MWQLSNTSKRNLFFICIQGQNITIQCDNLRKTPFTSIYRASINKFQYFRFKYIITNVTRQNNKTNKVIGPLVPIFLLGTGHSMTATYYQYMQISHLAGGLCWHILQAVGKCNSLARPKACYYLLLSVLVSGHCISLYYNPKLQLYLLTIHDRWNDAS